MTVLDFILLAVIILLLPPILALFLTGVCFLWGEFIINPVRHRWTVFQRERKYGGRRK